MTLRDLISLKCNCECADCQSSDTHYVDLSLGVFLCNLCAQAHQKLDSDVRLIPKDGIVPPSWPTDALTRLQHHVNNEAVNARLEAELPNYYRRPWPGPSCPDFLREDFVKSKYIHEEFSSGAAERGVQCGFACLTKSGVLLKKLRDGVNFCERLFELSVEGNFLRYFIKPGDSSAKQTLDLERLNITFIKPFDFDIPPHTALIQFVQDDSTRNMFIRSEDSRTILAWYNAIRYGKYHRLCIALAGMGMSTSTSDIVNNLTRDIDLGGWLYKTGPRKKDAWRRRWCMLIRRHLLYSDSPLSAFAKGEIFVGSYKEDYVIKRDTPDNWKRHSGFAFTIYTIHRAFVFFADTESERESWIRALDKLVNVPTTLEENKLAALVPGKRASTLDYLKKT